MTTSTTNLSSFPSIVVIAANTMNGPGLTTLCSVCVAAGRVPYVVLVVLAAIATCFVLKRLTNLLWRSSSKRRSSSSNVTVTTTSISSSNDENNYLDLVALSDRLWKSKKSMAIVMVGCALSLALAQMMLCAAILDSMLAASFGKSCGVGLLLTDFQIHCTTLTVSMKPFIHLENIPTALLSQGLVMASAITISLAWVDMDSMMTAQYVLFGCLSVACGRFCYALHGMADYQEGVQSIKSGSLKATIAEEEASKFFGPSPFDAIGPVLFNFAFVVTAPPLSNGAVSEQSATRALVVSVVIMAILYIVVGMIGGKALAAIKSTGEDGNLLSLVLRGSLSGDTESLNGMDVMAVMLFGLSQLAAIPVYCELARETLTTHLNVRNAKVAFTASNILPWCIVALTYNSALFEAFVEWSSLLLLGFANFSLPLLLDHHALSQEHKLHRPGSGPDAVLWGLCLITASIASVIIQRMTSTILLAEVTFMATVLVILKYEREPAALLPKVSSELDLQLSG